MKRTTIRILGIMCCSIATMPLCNYTSAKTSTWLISNIQEARAAKLGTECYNNPALGWSSASDRDEYKTVLVKCECPTYTTQLCDADSWYVGVSASSACTVPGSVTGETYMCVPIWVTVSAGQNSCSYCKCDTGHTEYDYNEERYNEPNRAPYTMSKTTYTPKSIAKYNCGVTTNVEWGCSDGQYVYDYLSDGTAYECGRCLSIMTVDNVNMATVGYLKELFNTQDETSCYAPSGYKYKDTSGIFEFSSDCYYSRK